MLMLLVGIHVLCGVFWLGSVLFADFVLMPTITSLDPQNQAAVMEPLGKRASKAMIPVSFFTLLSGITLGIYTGILYKLSTPYGWTWIASIVITGVLMYWGAGVINPAERKLKSLTPGTPEFAKQFSRIKMLIMTELFAMLILFVFMVLMRFGL
ncbi:hypothetical protein AB7942_26405 [Neobacillus sp. BF23-41]|uniref:hypothetical protein n=1 Tax=Neobacillus sp. BF23-41 TaxID=3240280 RepID=UPI0034E53B1D